MRRCLDVAVSGMVMKDMCEAESGVVSFLSGYQLVSARGRRKDPREGEYLHPYSHVDIPSWHSRATKEDMPAVTPGASNLYGVLPAVCSGCVKGDGAALVAVGSTDGPFSLVPT